MSNDPQQAIEKLSSDVTSMMDRLDVKFLRPMQRDVHLGVAECFNNPSWSRNQVETCANNKMQKLQHANTIISNEVQAFQQRIQRCMQACDDEVDPYSDRRNDGGLNPAKESCMKNCVSKFSSQVVPMSNKLEKSLVDLSRL